MNVNSQFCLELELEPELELHPKGAAPAPTKKGLLWLRPKRGGSGYATLVAGAGEGMRLPSFPDIKSPPPLPLYIWYRTGSKFL